MKLKRVLIGFLAVCLMMSNFIFFGSALQTFAEETKTKVIIHYSKDKNSELDWNLWLWEVGKEGKKYEFTGKDDFGLVGEYEFSGGTEGVGFIVRTDDWVKDVDEDRFITEFVNGKAEIWLFAGDPKVYTESPDMSKVAKSMELGNETEVTVHYHRFDNNYDGWNLWMWPDGKGGATYEFSEEDEYGKIARIKVSETEGVNKIGFITRFSTGDNEWASKEFGDRFITKFTEDGKAEVWLVQGNEGVYYDVNDVDLNPKFISATLDSLKEINVEANIDFPFNYEGNEGFIVKSNGKPLEISVYSTEVQGGRTKKATIELLEDAPLEGELIVEKEGYGSKRVALGKVMNSDSFNELYFYDGDDLGNIYTKEKTTFKVWSPFAEEMYLVVYDDYTDESGVETPMVKGQKGVWEITLDGDKDGLMYRYKVKVNGKYDEAVDPYVRAVTVNGGMGVVLDLTKTNPKGWKNHKRPEFKNYNDAIIYELHTRDLSMHPESGVNNKGKFLGLIEEDTTGPEGTKTGLNHIKDLGVTHVQLLPIYDYGSVDETGDGTQFNWGYDPVNYNAIEGSYSTDAYKPEVRINELKEVVKGFHKNGLRVIMDVVYNHMWSAEGSSFNKLVPGYFFRYNADGTFANESGCGNVIASENKMARKFIVDSVKYLAQEYNLDGFRFDLMGLLDVETMNELRAELKEIDPSIIVIGEGWNMGAILNEDEKASQTNAYKMPNIGHFNDSIRDGLKGSVFEEEDRGFVNGKEGMENIIKAGVVGGVNYSDTINTWGDIEPDRTVTYVEAHDNNTLWDKLEISNPEDSEEARKDMHRLTDAIILTSQGIPFIHAGQEFMRTKYGDENSYKSSDEVNRLDWQRKLENMDTVEYFKGLIKMRKEHPAFRMTSSEAIKKSIEFIDSPKNTVAYTIKDGANSDSWNNIFVAFNANKEDVEIELPSEGKWNVVVNKEKSGTEVIEIMEGKTVKVPALGSVVMYDKEKSNKLIFLCVAAFVVVAAVGAGIFIGMKKK
ncbi:type I pullulanase [Oceanirhabdus sp. W0125-5]|uniref:type I pullulanase n=1 Tax=Oceanirhabdus sp. W0125-5 TaxID=2999116 RepID=UPI0022F2A554|nr:type I pullulanase [Oceanirhabdus sp. W0125-5]WBW98636.1 type I pullulanase [Oceanirhabdus sp. W0125-5]